MTKVRTPILLTLGLVAGLTVALAGPASAAPAPAGSVAHDAFFPSGDGTVLHAEYLLPEDGCNDVVNANGTTGCPTVVSMGPYFGSGVQDGPVAGYGDLMGDAVVSDRFFDFNSYLFDTDGDGEGDSNIFDMGYAWVQVDSRGYGESGGCNDYGGHGEQMDIAAAVTWAGTQSWSNGNVATWGKSYDAWTQVMALAENPPHLEAAVIQAPIIDGYGIAYVNGVHHDAGWYATTGLYTAYDYHPNSIPALQQDPQGHINATLGLATGTCWQRQHVEVLNPDRTSPYWVERDLRPRAGRNDDVAVFYTHGFTDVNTKPDQVFGVYDGLNLHNSDKTRAWFGQWNHVRGSDRVNSQPASEHAGWVVGRAGWNEEALDWLNHYLRGEEFTHEVNAKNIVEAQDNDGNWRTEARYPATDTRDDAILPIAPGSYTDESSSSGYWTLSPEVTETFRIVGESTVTIDVDFTVPFAQFVGVLYDVGSDGESAEEISRTMYRFPSSGEYTFTTHPGDWVLRPGHRLGFEISSNHSESFPYPTFQEVTVNGGSVQMPVPEFQREINLGGQAPSATSHFRDQVGGTVHEVDVDMDALGARPYTKADAKAGIPNPQGDLEKSKEKKPRPGEDEPEEEPLGPVQEPIEGDVTCTCLPGAGSRSGSTSGFFEFDVNPGQAQLDIEVTSDTIADPDLYLQIQEENGSWSQDLTSGTSGQLNREVLSLTRPDEGHYRVEIHNWAGAPGMAHVSIQFDGGT